MLIKKGGITRNIDENRLHEYKAKGYAPLEAPEAAPTPADVGEKKQTKKPNAKE